MNEASYLVSLYILSIMVGVFVWAWQKDALAGFAAYSFCLFLLFLRIGVKP